ncbi:MAG TPA: aminotransferase class V-fold PLP-dependent enzyme [Bdellovibrionota bacterium]|nr:aminotransferase class V-fold PLP-dependent enzyme [Bdellovibrionota bacterium]
MITQRAVYLDCNATHPLLPAVREGLRASLASVDPEILNPSSVHRHGQSAKAMVARLRAALGAYVGRADGDEWVFTSGATEAINTVLRGFCANRRSESRLPFVITSSAEHSAVLETLAHCGAAGVQVIGVDRHGQPDIESLSRVVREILQDERADVLVSLNLVNNETGVLLDYERLAAALTEIREAFERREGVTGSKRFYAESLERRVWLHLDAAQAFGKIEPRHLRMAWYQADYASVSAHKLGAASGIGALWLRPQVPFAPFVTGGVQEKKRRAGTFNSLAALSWLLALEDWRAHGDAYRSHMKDLRALLHARLAKTSGYHVHGLTSEGDLPAAVNTLNFHIDDCDEESLVMALDVEGFSVSSGSACNSGSLKPSHVLLAMGYDAAIALASVRLSLGVETTAEEITDFADALEAIVSRIRDGKNYWAGVLPQMRATPGGGAT